jgi:serine/threonine protein kinase/tetratricopeptide (TPR) repeat protein
MPKPPENWEGIKALFEAALAEETTRRSSFLRERCSDETVRAEVERLLAEYEQAGTFLSTPALDNCAADDDSIPVSKRLEEGVVLAGRFRIIRFIASGGMGEVYEAEDGELRERVAVKTIRPEILTQPNAIARFRREVHLARQVTHPNVCRIFDLFRHKPAERPGQDVVFVSMELLHGNHLGKTLQDSGPMEPDEALPLIRQMSSALAAAHAVGIIHRDFKPQNVVLVAVPGQKKKRAVVTDFGLALQSESSLEGVSFTTGQGLLGTPAYMSPEQVEGRVATPASDIYALGLVIYEMVTGKRPFKGDTPISVAMKRLSEAPTPPRKIKAAISPLWESVILRCLERDPTKRLANAEDVAHALAGEGTTVSQLQTRPKHRNRSVVVFSTALLAAAVGLTYAVRHRHRPGDTVAKASVRRSVAVLGFKNLSGRPEEGWLSTALSELLTSELAAGEQLRTVPGENLAQMKVSLGLQDEDSYGKDTLSRIQRVVDADDVLVGSYLALGKETGGKVHMDLKLQDVRAGETTAVIVEEGTEDNLPDLVSRAGAALLERLGVTGLTQTQASGVIASASGNSEVNRWYAQGLTKLRLDDAGAARDLLQQAVSADPAYAPAHSALAVAWTGLGYEAKAQEESRKAFDLSTSLPREQRLIIEARFYTATHQWDKAIDTYDTLFGFFPDNVEYGINLASTQINSGKAKDALDTLQALQALSTPSRNDPRIDVVRAHAFEGLGDLKSAQAAASRASATARSQGSRLVQAQADIQLCFALSALGSFDPALLACKEAERTYAATDNHSGLARALMNTGNVLADKGAYAEAKTAYEQAIANYSQIGNKIDLAWAKNNLGTVIIELGDRAGARKEHNEALVLFQETQQKRGQAATYNNLADVAQGEGNLEQAIAYLGHALALQRELGDKRRTGLVLRNLAEVNYRRGRLRDARADAQAAADAGRAAGSKEILGDALTTLGSVQNAEFRTSEASSTWQAAEAIFTELGHKPRLALCWIELARISIDNGQTALAGTLAQKAVDSYHSEKDNENEAVARLVLSEAMLVGGDISGARRELNQASAHPINPAPQTRWALVVDGARVRAATGASAEALQALKSVITEADHLGYVTEMMEARLAFNEIRMNLGQSAAPVDLAALEKDARAKGFLLIAHKAAEAVKHHAP